MVKTAIITQQLSLRMFYDNDYILYVYSSNKDIILNINITTEIRSPKQILVLTSARSAACELSD